MQAEQPPDEALVYHPSKVAWVTAEFVRRPPAWMPRAFIYGLTIALLSAVGYASLARVAIHIESRGVLTSQPQIMPIVVPISFTVARLHVQEGQTVEQGALLLSTRDDLPQQAFEKLRSATSETRAVLADHRAGGCQDCRQRLAKVAPDALAIGGVPELEATLEPARDALNSLLNAFAEYDRIDASTASSRRLIAVNAEKLAQVRARQAERILEREVEQLTNEIVAARNQIADRTRAVEAAVEAARDRLDVLLTTVVGMLEVYRTQRSITAPLAGSVHALRISGDGQFVAGGTEILQLIPRGATFVAKLAIPDKDISRVRSGLPVLLRLDAFPEREYGTLAGTVESVPLTATLPGPGQPPVYEVVVRLQRQAIGKGKEEYPFRIGMMVEGRIITRHESMLTNAVRKLLSITDGVDA